MTKEECISLLNSYAEYGNIGIPNLIRFREAMRTAAELLQQPLLPSNLDEAAEKYSENILANNEDLQDAIEDAFKDGAEWSEEDKHRLQQAINALSRNGYFMLVDWLQLLPERFNLEPKQK